MQVTLDQQGLTLVCCNEILILSQCVYFSKHLEPPSVYVPRLVKSVFMHDWVVYRESKISVLKESPWNWREHLSLCYPNWITKLEDLISHYNTIYCRGANNSSIKHTSLKEVHVIQLGLLNTLVEWIWIGITIFRRFFCIFQSLVCFTSLL